VGYAVGLIDDAVNGTLAEGVTNGGLVEMQAIVADFRRPDDAAA
jgi:hypothetical protein